MKTASTKTQQQSKTSSFDLARLTHAKDIVDISPNTIRSYFDQGLNRYKLGKAVFFSISELEGFIRSKAKAA